MNILYTTHCPQCKVLEKMLDDKGVKYEVETDVEKMSSKGFSSVPRFEHDGKIMNMKDTMKWLREEF